jgi:putative salt-induced outer membrane protein YdiY
MTIKMKISRWIAAALLFAGAAAAQAQTTAPATSTNAAPPKSFVAPPPSPWTNTISLGVTIARGNTDTTLASASASTEKTWLQNHLIIGADGLYGESRVPGESSEQETAETLHGFSQFNRTFWGSAWNGFYGYGRIDGFHDGIADIKYRLTITPGLGYYFVTNKTVDFCGEIGPGYIKEQLDGDSESFATLRMAEKLHYNISAHAKAWETVEILPQIDEFNNYIVNAEVGIEAGLTKGNKLSLRSVLQDEYNNIPAPGRLKNDLKLITSLVYKF